MVRRGTLAKGCSIYCLCSGTLAILGGVAILASFAAIVHALVSAQVPLTHENGQPADQGLGQTAQIWADPPFTITMQFYIFNVTNPDEVITKGAKPAVIQHGPYGYIEHQHKFDLQWYQDNGNGPEDVKYKNWKNYTYSQEYSCAECSENDEFTVPNVVLLLASQMLLSATKGHEELRYPASVILAAIEDPFVTHSARELIFDGYSDFILNITSSDALKGVISILHLLDPAIAIPDLSGLPTRMGFFFGKNNAFDGIYDIKTGVNDVTATGNINQWNGSSLTNESWWMTTQASMINGTDGTLFAPFVSRSDIPRIFVTDICRSVYLTYEKDIQFRSVDGYRFTVPARVFSSSVPENQGFCVNTAFTNVKYYPSQNMTHINGHEQYCLPDGMLDVSNCQPGNPPVIVTSPHFLFCPDEVVDSIEGLHPNKEEHETVVDLEPNTGVGMHFARKLQINIAIQNNKDLVQFQNVRDVIIPILWLNESAQLDDKTYETLYTQIVVLQSAGYAMGFVALALGAAMLLGVAVTILVIKVQRRRDPNRAMANPIYAPSANTTAHPSASTTPEIMRRARQAEKEAEQEANKSQDS